MSRTYSSLTRINLNYYKLIPASSPKDKLKCFYSVMAQAQAFKNKAIATHFVLTTKILSTISVFHSMIFHARVSDKLIYTILMAGKPARKWSSKKL